MDGCIFCKIVAGDIPADVVYESDKVLAFRDINPQAPVHVLVIPKEHHDNIIDGVPAATLEEMVKAIDKVVEIEGIKDSGFRVITNTGEDSGQLVKHLHFHVLGGRSFTSPDGAR